MPRKKKDEEVDVQNSEGTEANQDKNTTKKSRTRSNKGKRVETQVPELEGHKEEVVYSSEHKDGGTLRFSPQDSEIVLPISMIYKGKRYFEGTKIGDEPEEVQQALLLKLLAMLGEEE